MFFGSTCDIVLYIPRSRYELKVVEQFNASTVVWASGKVASANHTLGVHFQHLIGNLPMICCILTSFAALLTIFDDLWCTFDDF